MTGVVEFGLKGDLATTETLQVGELEARRCQFAVAVVDIAFKTGNFTRLAFEFAREFGDASFEPDL